MTATQQLLACQFPACAEEMGSVRLKLRKALEQRGLAEPAVNDLVLAVGEACMNIMQHAYGQQDKGDIVLEVEMKEEMKQVETTNAMRLAGNGKPSRQLVFRLTDFARHKSSAAEMKPRPLDEIRPGGLGCHIINQVMDEVVLLDRGGQSGNVLELRKRV
ncbi:MAG TPA: ATP-binding protein [Candidatus Acidoferrum sp.]|nr:ATP-binding protein [Candidatus Acidoferrum sp.]